MVIQNTDEFFFGMLNIVVYETGSHQQKYVNENITYCAKDLSFKCSPVINEKGFYPPLHKCAQIFGTFGQPMIVLLRRHWIPL